MTAFLAWFMTCAMIEGGPRAGAQTAPTTDPTVAREQKFLQGLRDRHYFDLVREQLEALRVRPDTPPGLKDVLDLEAGRALLDEASDLSDLDRRRELLDQARVRLDAFVNAHAKHPRAPEARVTLARLSLERGQAATIQANEAPEAAEKTRRLAEARAAFAEARKDYDAAITPLRDAYDSFPKFLREDDPRRPERDNAHVALMDAQIQRILVDYEEAQTYPSGDDKRNGLLDRASAELKNFNDTYRRWLAGYFARMWQAKCYEERGDLGGAMSIYNDLLSQEDASLTPLKKQVAYFRIIVHGRRDEHALAVDRASEWLNLFPSSTRTQMGLGVRFQLAKNILAQLPDLAESEREIAVRRATDLLADVVRYPLPVRGEAIELLKKYRPGGAAGAGSIANLSYDDATRQAEAAVSTREWSRAIALLKQAITRADPTRDLDKANKARFTLAYCYYAQGNAYASAVAAEHLARVYPRFELAPKAAEVGLSAWAQAYNSYRKRDPISDLDHLVDLARYTAATWPATDTGDLARMTLGDVAMGRGAFEEAVASYLEVRPESRNRADALMKAGDARWRHGLALRESGDTATADQKTLAARGDLENALELRKKAGLGATDPGILANLSSLAEVLRASGQTKEALALLEPAAKAVGDGPLTGEAARLRTSLLTVLLRAQIADGQADPAIATMKALEQAAEAGTSLAPLYYELGRSLRKELDTLESSKDASAKERIASTRKAYIQFLKALAASKTGQTSSSLLFAGDGLLQLGDAEAALSVLDAAIPLVEKEKTANTTGTSGPDRSLAPRVKRVEALRKLKRFDDAQTALDGIVKDAPQRLEPMLEQGYLYQALAKDDPKFWGQAYQHWKRLATILERARPRPISYYECQYQAAESLAGMGRKTQATQLLRGVLTLSPTAGSADMKQRYQELIKRMGP
jgi:tetratricopeptide (TPR) repeat protein